MYVRSHLFIALAAVLLPCSAAAAVLKGTIEDTSGAPIADATIVVACPNDARSTTSNSDGVFAVSGLPAAHCSVSGARDQFSPTMITVDLSAGSASVRIVLPVQTLGESVVVTTAGGFQESATDVPAGVSIIGPRELAARPYQVLPQILREEAGVSVQQTTTSAGSPIIRGFTGQSNVYLVDGVRLNTSMWRSGPVQYMGWLSRSNVERLELVRGPMSVQYGSDGLGGAINVIAARPAFSLSGVTVGGVVDSSVASADRSAGVEGSVTVSTPRAALLVSGGTKSVGDLRAGGGRDSHAAVTRFLGLPSDVLAERLPSTGYEQHTALLSGQVRVGLTGVLSASYRRDEQDGVNRYDRIAGGQGLFRSEITPQRLDLAILRYERALVPVVGGLRVTFSVNRQEDGASEQARPLPSSAINSERTAVRALGYQVQASRRLDALSLVYGGEHFDETIDAERQRETAGVVSPVRPLIPDATTYRSTGLFAQAVSRELFGRLVLRGGTRYNRYNYQTVADPAFAVAAEDLTFDAVTFNAAASVAITRDLRLTGSAARGFRAANASDLGAIGVSGGGGFEIAPSTAAELGGRVGTSDANNAVSTGRSVGALGPESVMAYEAGLRFSRARMSASATFFDLELRDAIQRRAVIFESNVVGTVISGREIVRQDDAGRAFIAIDPRPIATRVNSSRGRIQGLDAEAAVEIGRDWYARGWFSMANGRDLETDRNLRRMNPPMGGTAVAWTGAGKLRVEGVMTFARTQTRLASGDLGDARIGARRTAETIAGYFNGTAVDLGLVRNGVLQATGETLAQVQARVLNGADSSLLFDDAPGWVAFGARAIYPLSPRVQVVLIGENLADRNYRLIGSGVDSPGRNVQARLRVTF